VVDELPRSLIGKVLHREVRAMLEAHPDRRP
jgi:acyl-coenzyme A synthetase/AMP-(fatty) acid ligase